MNATPSLATTASTPAMVGAEQKTRIGSVTTLQWAAGLYLAFIGALMIVAPHQFSGALWTGVAGWVPWLGPLFLLVSILMVAATALDAPRRTVLASHVGAGAAMLVLAFNWAATGLLAGALYQTVFALSVIALPFLRAVERPGRPNTGYSFALALGLINGVWGALMLLAPEQFRSPVYDPIRPNLALYGAGFLTSGAALVLAQGRLARPKVFPRLAHLAVLVPSLLYALAVPLPIGAWPGILTFGVFPLLVAFLPWFGPRLRSVDPRSLTFRLALVLAIVAALPLIATVGLAASSHESLVRTETEGSMETLASSMADTVSRYVGSYRAALAGLAAYPGVLALPPSDQEALLHSFAQAFPDSLAIAISDATGQQIARSDDLPHLSNSGIGVFEQARRDNAPSLEVRLSRSGGVPAIAMGAPIRAPDGRFGGVVVGGFSSERVAEILNETNLGPGRRAYLVDGDGRAIAHPDQSLVANFADLSSTPVVARERAAPAERGVVSDATASGGVLAAYSRLPDLGWTIVVERSSDMALAPTREQRNMAFGLLLGVVAAAVVGGSVLARQLAHPLSVLSQAARQLGRGNREALLPRGGGSEVEALVAAFREMWDDLTASQLALRETSDYLEKLLACANAPIIVWDPALHVTRFNHAFEHLTGYEAHEVVGQDLSILFPPASRDQSLAEIAATSKGEHWESVEIPIQRKDGDVRLALWNSANVYAKDGRTLLATIAQGQDITERKQAEDALREAQARLEAVFRSMTEGVVVVDTRGNVISINEAAKRIVSFDALPGHVERLGDWGQVHEFCDLNDRPVPLEEWPVSRALRGETYRNYEIAVNQKNIGLKRVWSYGGAPLRADDGSIAMAVITITDITERKRAEAERGRLLASEREARTQAEEAVRIRDEFLSVAAHELKTPITTLRGYAQALLRQLRSGTVDPSRLKTALSQFDRQSDHLARLVNQLLDFSRLEEGKLILERRVADVAGIAGETVALFQSLHPLHHFVFEAEGPLLASVDGLRLQQVIVNLLDNAVKFAGGEGPIDVAVRRAAAGAAEINVRDHGPGIPEAERDRVFERFHQAHDDWHGGLGLGLFISRQIVELHGGTIDVESPDDGGSRFVVLLPDHLRNMEEVS